MSRLIAFISLLLLLLAIAACKPGSAELGSDKALARVYNNYLKSSDLEGMVAPGTSAEDSALIANAYVDRWTREQAMLHQAEKNIPKNLNIDELVRDYRASLVRYHYDKLIVDLELDSVITQAELISNYEAQQESFVLTENYYRYHIVIIDQADPNFDKVQEWWSNPDDQNQWQALTQYCNENKLFFALGEAEWMSEGDLKELLPQEVIVSKLVVGKSRVIKSDEKQYFIRVLDKVYQGKLSPLELVKDQVKKIILHKRKIALVESKTEEIYKRESELNNVEIFN